jgi:hypothetical protein
MVEPGDLEQLPHQTRNTADAHLSAPITQLLGDPDNRTKTHAAHIREIAQVKYQARMPLRNAGLALRLERRSALGIHATGYAQHNLVPNQSSLDGHDRQKSASRYSQRQFFKFSPSAFSR